MYNTYQEFLDLSSTLISNSITEEEYNNFINQVDRTYIDGQLIVAYDVPFHKIPIYKGYTANVDADIYNAEIYNVNYNYNISGVLITFQNTYEFTTNYGQTGQVGQALNIISDDKTLAAILIQSGDDFQAGDTILFEFDYNYPAVIREASFNYAAWFYLTNYFTQISPDQSTWVEGYKTTADEIIRQIRDGLIKVQGHTRKDGFSSAPQIQQGEIDV